MSCLPLERKLCLDAVWGNLGGVKTPAFLCNEKQEFGNSNQFGVLFRAISERLSGVLGASFDNYWLQVGRIHACLSNKLSHYPCPLEDAALGVHSDDMSCVLAGVLFAWFSCALHVGDSPAKTRRRHAFFVVQKRSQTFVVMKFEVFPRKYSLKTCHRNFTTFITLKFTMSKDISRLVHTLGAISL